MNAKLFFILAITCCITSVGCGILPDRNVKRTVDPAELVGIWELTSESLALLKREGYTPATDQVHRLEFLPDGEMSYASVHDGVEFNYVDQRAVWYVKNENKIAITIKQPNLTTYSGFGIAEENGRLILWSFLGDPDSWEFIEYKRINAR